MLPHTRWKDTWPVDGHKLKGRADNSLLRSFGLFHSVPGKPPPPPRSSDPEALGLERRIRPGHRFNSGWVHRSSRLLGVEVVPHPCCACCPRCCSRSRTAPVAHAADPVFVPRLLLMLLPALVPPSPAAVRFVPTLCSDCLTNNTCCFALFKG